MRNTLFRITLTTALVVVLVGTAGQPAGAAPSPATAAGVRAAADPVDGTDWGCRPSAAHPNPVVLLHGTGGNAESLWLLMAPRLAEAGYCVFTPTYGQVAPDIPTGGLAPVAESAQQVADYVEQVRQATGADEVDIVGHSQGGLLGLYLPKVLGLGDRIGTVVALGPPTNGTTVSGLVDLAEFLGLRDLVDDVLRAFGCAACIDVLPGSEALAIFNDNGPIAQPGVDYTIVATRFDLVVTPSGSAFVDEPGVHNLHVQDVCPFDPVGHIGLALDPGVMDIVDNALDPEGVRPVRCGIGLPF